jgi:hypothetical protein
MATISSRLPTEDSGGNDVGDEAVAIDPVGPEVEADCDNLGSPETYLGTD